MRKSELVNQISKKTGDERVAVRRVIDHFMKSVSSAIIDGNEVYLRGFGTFKRKRKAQKKGRQFKTNTELVIPEHQIPAFKPSRKFLEAVKSKTIKRK